MLQISDQSQDQLHWYEVTYYDDNNPSRCQPAIRHFDNRQDCVIFFNQKLINDNQASWRQRQINRTGGPIIDIDSSNIVTFNSDSTTKLLQAVINRDFESVINMIENGADISKISTRPHVDELKFRTIRPLEAEFSKYMKSSVKIHNQVLLIHPN